MGYEPKVLYLFGPDRSGPKMRTESVGPDWTGPVGVLPCLVDTLSEMGFCWLVNEPVSLALCRYKKLFGQIRDQRLTITLQAMDFLTSSYLLPV